MKHLLKYLSPDCFCVDAEVLEVSVQDVTKELLPLLNECVHPLEFRDCGLSPVIGLEVRGVVEEKAVHQSVSGDSDFFEKPPDLRRDQARFLERDEELTKGLPAPVFLKMEKVLACGRHTLRDGVKHPDGDKVVLHELRVMCDPAICSEDILNSGGCFHLLVSNTPDEERALACLLNPVDGPSDRTSTHLFKARSSFGALTGKIGAQRKLCPREAACVRPARA